MKGLVTFCFAVLVLSMSAQPTAFGQPNIHRGTSECNVSPIPQSLNAPSFYGKYCNASGIPVLAAREVKDKALVAAWKIVADMMRSLSPQVRNKLVAADVRVAIIGRNQGTADIPEYASSVQKQGAEALNKRARGLGGRVASAGEENLICLKKDRYKGESILIHEFAHTILNYGVLPADRKGTFERRLKRAFNDAKKRNHLLNLYAGTNTDEYWAEGVQTYFNANLPSDIKGRNSTSRKGLTKHDRALLKLIQEVFGHGTISQCHK
ncbi:MAG: hypothetical protein OQK24_04750 [Magnetovibrio sp.]|nr:hypothetical protein [Magnetovibrio sp.]